MKLIAGLGNPGEKYSKTRHNAGFMVLGEFASKHGITGKNESRFNAIVGKGVVDDQEVLLVEPLSFMNLSGGPISKLLNWHKIEKSDLMVVYDDLSLELGKIRFRPNGSDGGHNGIKSIINSLGGYKDFDRLKIGIGPQPDFMPSEAFVLQKFSDDEQKLMDKVVARSIEAIGCYLHYGINEAMNRFNGTLVE